MNFIKGNFNIGGTWYDVFDSDEFEHAMEQILDNPCAIPQSIVCDGAIVCKWGDDRNITIHTNAPHYIQNFFTDRGLI